MTQNRWNLFATVRAQRLRIEALEAEVVELQRQYVRMAELVDVVQELLIPIAQRDEARIAEAIEAFDKSL
ncbi:DUF6752 domain-containing protein [Nocardioides sp. LHD-245]|uniref:DUF6752 domain-containing protein n=1 Tax=Nocardioides sp. LHD-245 TaxID=3051387 RepID=UPI0027E0815C|nr:DUF6752 domain-containing protein [Nocardioides sp. LHD-245]